MVMLITTHFFIDFVFDNKNGESNCKKDPMANGIVTTNPEATSLRPINKTKAGMYVSPAPVIKLKQNASNKLSFAFRFT